MPPKKLYEYVDVIDGQRVTVRRFENPGMKKQVDEGAWHDKIGSQAWAGTRTTMFDPKTGERKSGCYASRRLGGC